MTSGDRQLALRRATEADGRMLWEWVNDPAVRDASFSSSPISWAEHLAWFQGRLASPNSAIFIILDAGAIPVGQVRFDRRPDGVTEVDVSVVRSHRGQGIASAGLRLAVDEFQRTGRSAIVANVKALNAPSLRAFRAAGFRETARVVLDGFDAVRMER